ncbi:hypothetical protein SAMN03159496_00066 [Rhizobium sp. NFR07]|uniref:hypothetical protein n=1 Tax=Rhizobium sp. NFR07 TaxID=1566262 RepID=UPI0008E55819|nr:hypothetical protein [Rhizobium sp. NFR07]SFA73588.1 hypothetical protein SAMN03159496_00066 [Rhizobium sp. NFR07]
MKTTILHPKIRPAISTACATLVLITLSSCMSAEEQRRADLYQDGGTCSDFGAPYGSRAHTDCMLRQQDRRDNEQLMNMERARISSETARNNVEMLRLMRERRNQ